MITVMNICKRDVVYADREMTIDVAAKLMRTQHVVMLVVVDSREGRRVPAGLLTGHDIVIGVDALNLDAKVITVGDLMSTELFTVRESEELPLVVDLMWRNGVRRVPVIGDEGELTGIVSTDDLLDVFAAQMTELAWGRDQASLVMPQRRWRG